MRLLEVELEARPFEQRRRLGVAHPEVFLVQAERTHAVGLLDPLPRHKDDLRAGRCCREQSLEDRVRPG